MRGREPRLGAEAWRLRVCRTVYSNSSNNCAGSARLGTTGRRSADASRTNLGDASRLSAQFSRCFSGGDLNSKLETCSSSLRGSEVRTLERITSCFLTSADKAATNKVSLPLLILVCGLELLFGRRRQLADATDGDVHRQLTAASVDLLPPPPI